MDTVNSGYYLDFTDGVKEGPGFEFGDGFNSISQTYDDQVSMPPRLSAGRFIYDRLDGSSIEYSLQGSGVKEEIVLPAEPATNTISFDLKIGTSTLRREADGYHVISDAAEDLYTILDPNLRDSSGKSGWVTLDIMGERATLTMDADFLRSAQYPVVIDPTTITSGVARTGFAMQRKVFWDGNYYFVFYSNGSTLYYRTSSDGVTWSSAASVAAGVQGRDLAIWNNGPDVYAAYVSGYDVMLKKGTISGGTISWGTAYIALDGTSAAYRYDIPSVTRDSGGKLWLGARYYSGGNPQRYQVVARRSTNADDPQYWEATIHQLSTSGNTSSALFPSLVSLGSNKMLGFWLRGTAYEARYFDGSAWGSVMGIAGSPSPESDTYSPSAVVDTTGKAYLSYINASSKAAYRTISSPYNSSGLSDETTFSSGEAGFVSLSLDSIGGDIYGFYGSSFSGAAESEVRMKRLSDGAEVLLSDAAKNRGFDEVKLYHGGWQTETDDAADADGAGDVAHSATGVMLSTASSALQVADKDKFERVAIKLSQTAQGVTGLSVKYWNGSAFVPLTFTDGTANLSVTDGAVSFSAPADWQKNSSGLYAVQIRLTNTPTRAPIGSLVNNFQLSRYVTSPYTVQGRPYAFWMDGQNAESFNLMYAQAQTSGSLAGASRAPSVGESFKTASLSVNTANGNASVSFGDLATPARGIPASVSHVYNSRAALDSPYGYNWSISPEESLDTRNPDGSVSYHTSDGHIYRFDLVGGAYVPEKGLYLTLVKNGDQTYTITDKGKNTADFSSTGVLDSRADRNGNTTTYEHGSYGRLTKITDSAGQETNLTYQSGAAGKLSSISAPGSRTMSYGYDAATGDLTSYTNAEGKTTVFGYDPSHQMTRVEDPKNGAANPYRIYYTKSMVTRVEKPSVEDLGVTYQRLDYYQDGTRLIDPAGARSTYSISPFGDAESAKDPDGLMSSAEHDAAGQTTGTLSYQDKALADNFDTDTRGEYSFSGGGATAYAAEGAYLNITTGDGLTRTMDIPEESTATSVRLQGSFYVNAKHPTTGTLELRLRKKAGGDYYAFKVPIDRSDATLTKKVSGSTTTLGTSPTVRMHEAPSGGTIGWHTLAVEIESTGTGNGTLRGYLDGKVVLSAADSSIAAGGTFSLVLSQMDAYVDELRVYERDKRTSAEYDDNGNQTSSTDEMDMTTHTTYDNNQPTHTWDDMDRHSYFTYDSRGNRLTETDPMNHTTTRTYSATNGELLSETDPRSAETTFTYEPLRGLVTELHQPNGGTKLFEYDVIGRETTTTDAMVRKTIHTFDAMGREIATEYPGGAKSFSKYDEVGDKLKDSRLADVALSDFEADDNWTGGTTDTAQTHQGVSSLRLSSSNGVVAAAEKTLGPDVDLAGDDGTGTPSGYVDLWVYSEDTSTLEDSAALAIRMEGAAGDFVYEAPASDFTTGWNLLHVAKGSFASEGAPTWDAVTTVRLQAKARAGENATVWADDLRLVKNKRLVSSTTLDAIGMPIEQTDAEGITTSSEHDAVGAELATTDGEKRTRTMAYGARHELTSSTQPMGASYTTSYTYDASGAMATERHPEGDEVTQVYNDDGQQTAQIDALGHTTKYLYDDAGRLERIVSPTEATNTTEFDDLSRETATIDANNLRTAYEFDPNSNETTVALPNNEQVLTDYNEVNLPKRLDRPDGTFVEYKYDLGMEKRFEITSEGTTTIDIDDAGRQNRITLPDGSVTEYGYDTQGNIISKREDTATIFYSYNEAGLAVREVHSPSGRIVTYERDNVYDYTEKADDNGEVKFAHNSNALVSEMKLPGETSATFDYDKNGNETTVSIPATALTVSDYDDGNRITSTVITAGGSEVLSDSYQYYDDDSVATETISGEVGSFTYDKGGRLTNWRVDGQERGSYEFDAVGNMTAEASDGATTNYTYDPSGSRLESVSEQGTSTAYLYDSEGRLVSRVDSGDSTSTTTYAWNGRGQLTALSKDGAITSYTYGIDGQRLSSSTNTETVNYVYRRGQLIAETDALGNITAQYYYSPDFKLYAVKKNGQMYYYHTNHRGDVLAITSESGTVVARYSYDPWGNVRSSSGSFADEQPFRYGGYYWEKHTKLYYLIARYYDPAIKRFLSPDPLANTQDNRYAYVGNNPVNGTDPGGLYTQRIAYGAQNHTNLVRMAEHLLWWYWRRGEVNHPMTMPNSTDGFFGEGTRDAVREYQDKWGAGMTSTSGVVDAPTWRRLLRTSDGNGTGFCMDMTGYSTPPYLIRKGFAGSDCYFSQREVARGNKANTRRCFDEMWARNIGNPSYVKGWSFDTWLGHNWQTEVSLYGAYHESRARCFSRNDSRHNDSWEYPQQCSELVPWDIRHKDRVTGNYAGEFIAWRDVMVPGLNGNRKTPR